MRLFFNGSKFGLIVYSLCTQGGTGVGESQRVEFSAGVPRGKSTRAQISALVQIRTLRDSIDQNAIRNREPAWEKVTGLKFQLSTYIEDNRDN